MVTLASSVVDRVLRKVRRSANLTLLDGAITNAQTTVILDNVTYVGNFSRLEIGSELMVTTAVDKPNRVVTVIRGFLGTTAASAVDNAPVFVDPEFLRKDILDSINECLDDLYPDLYQVGQKELTYSSSIIGYALDAGTPRPLAVWAEFDSTSKNWKPIGDWDIETQANLTDFAGGQALMIRTALPNGARVRVSYPKPFVKIADETVDLEAVAGLATYMVDLPFYYAMAYMLSERENQRSQIQSAQAHQRSEDVPAFSAMQMASWYRARYEDKKKEALHRLLLENRKILRTSYGS